MQFTYKGVGFPTCLEIAPRRCVIGDRYTLSNCSGDRVTDVGTVDSPYFDSLLSTAGCASPFCSMSLPIVLLSLPGTAMVMMEVNDGE